MSVKLTQLVPAFRIDDAVLEELWRALEAKWDGEKPSTNSLTVYETVRAAGRRTREHHQHEYRSVDELRRAQGGPGLLREYTLYVASWGSREVRFRAPGDGSAAAVEVTARDAEWCREVADAVLEVLRPHRLWYAIVHRGGPWALPLAAILALASVPLVVYGLGFPQWGVPAVALYLLFVVLALCRERILPAADILVREGGAREPGREPAGRESIVVLNDHRRRTRSTGSDTVSR